MEVEESVYEKQYDSAARLKYVFCGAIHCAYKSVQRIKTQPHTIKSLPDCM